MNESSTLQKVKATDKLLAATVLKFVPHWVTPNHLTVFRFCAVPVLFWLLWEEKYVWGLVLFAVTVVTDALDGALARTRNQHTEWGESYDPLADKLLIITTCAVLMTRFLNLYVFFAVTFIELLIIANGVFLKIFKGKPIEGAHTSGKIKMFFQSVGTAGLFVYAITGGVVPLAAISVVFYIAIAFGIMSLFVYKNI